MRAPRVCDVEVDAGEVQNVSIGDTSRWLVHPAFSGGRETLTLHVMVKPSEHGIATNAIITTNRRTYYFGLVSKAKTGPAYVRHVKGLLPVRFRRAGERDVSRKDFVGATRASGPRQVSGPAPVLRRRPAVRRRRAGRRHRQHRFTETDREFQAWRRRTQNGPGAGPVTS